MRDDTGAVHVHRPRAARIGTLALVGFVTAVSLQQMLQPDYNTNRRAEPGEYLWYTLPALAMVCVLAWRVWRSRIETRAEGVRVVRSTTTEEVAWDRLRRFEVRRTPGGGGWLVLARTTDERVTRVAGVPGRSDRAKAKADALAAALEADRPPTPVGSAPV